MKTQKVPISQVSIDPHNPRTITKAKFKELKQSIIDFPEMQLVKPLIVADGLVIGGNMRLLAMKDLGYREVHIIDVTAWSQAKRDEFMIKDNTHFGSWDWDVLANEWDTEGLEEWGMDLPTSWGVEDALMDDKEINDNEYFAVVVVAYEDISDLDKITSLYELDSINITEDIKSQISSQRKVYVFKK